MNMLGGKHTTLLSFSLLLIIAVLITPIRVLSRELERNLIVIQLSKVAHSIAADSDSTAIDKDQLFLLDQRFFDLANRVGDNILIWYHLSQLKYWSGEYERAISVLVPQLQENQFPLASFILGSAFWEMNNFAEARSSWQQASDIENYLLIQALIAESERNYSEAEDNYQKLLALSPGHPEAFSGYQFVRGINLLSSPNSEPVRRNSEIINQALLHNSDSVTRQLRLGIALYQANQYKLAKVALQRAQQLEPRSHWPRYYLGLIYLAEKDYFHAKEKLLETVEIAPNYARGHHWLARTMVQLGQNDLALYHYRLAAELLPEDSALNNEISLFVENMKNSK